MPQPLRQDRRQHTRVRAAWPVVIKVGTTRYLARSVNISSHGAKVRTNARLKPGATAQLELVPPDGSPLHIEALVWRVDPDGLAFLFSQSLEHRLIPAH